MTIKWSVDHWVCSRESHDWQFSLILLWFFGFCFENEQHTWVFFTTTKRNSTHFILTTSSESCTKVLECQYYHTPFPFGWTRQQSLSDPLLSLQTSSKYSTLRSWIGAWIFSQIFSRKTPRISWRLSGCEIHFGFGNDKPWILSCLHRWKVWKSLLMTNIKFEMKKWNFCWFTTEFGGESQNECSKATFPFNTHGDNRF